MSPRREERGAVTVLVAGAMAIVVTLTLAVTDLGRVLRARTTARAAADAAALAAAQELALPSGRDPAALAAEYASANGATLVGCACDPGTFEAVVEAGVAVGNLWLVPGTPVVTQRARAVVDLPT